MKSYKCFIGHSYIVNKGKALNIMLPETSAYVKSYDGQIKWMYFLIEPYGLLEKYNSICDKVCANIKKNAIVSLPIKKIFENQNKISWL